MSLPIRYSPSGPIIDNGEGGEAVPGMGFQLRCVDLLDTAGALTFSASDQVIPGDSGSFIIEITDPKPGLRYAAQLFFDAESIGAAGYDLDVCAFWSVDGGVFAKNALLQENRFRQSAAIVASSPAAYNSPLTLGSALPAPVLTGSTSLRVEFGAKVSSGAGSISLASTVFGRLVETF